MYCWSTANLDLINQYYLNVLGRIVDLAGRDYWLEAMGKRGPTVGQVLFQFSQSSENCTVVADELQQGVVFLEDGVSYLPIAHVAAVSGVATSTAVRLDDRSSSASLGLTLRYSWRLTRLPAGSQAALTAADAAQSSFVPDMLGQYEASLIVVDGSTASGPGSYAVSTFVGQAGVPAYFEGVGEARLPSSEGHALAPDGTLFVASGVANGVARVAGRRADHRGGPLRQQRRAARRQRQPGPAGPPAVGNLYETEVQGYVVRRIALKRVADNCAIRTSGTITPVLSTKKA